MHIGIFVFFLSCILGWLSWQQFKKQQYRWALLFLILLGLGLRIFLASDLFLHPWDERYHALVAKNMMNHPLIPTLYDNPVLPYDYTQWTTNHVWLHKQPFSLWGIMLSYMVFGVNEFALRFPSVFLSTLGIWVMYRIGHRLFNKQIGYYAAFLFAIHGIIIEFVSGRVPTDHIDIFFLFQIQFAVLMAVEYSLTKKKIYNILCGLFIGFAILTKWLPGLIVLPIWLSFLLHQKFPWKTILLQGSLLCSIVVVIALPWQLHIHSNFPQEALWEATFNRRHLFEYIEVKRQPILYHFNMLQINYGPLIYLPILWLIYKSIQRKNTWKYWGLLSWFLIPYLFFTFAKTKMQGYTLFAAPALFLISGIFTHYLFINRHLFRKKWVVPTLIILLFALPVRLTIERTKPFNNQTRTATWRNEMIGFADKIKSSKSVLVFNEPQPIEMMFYTNAIAYDYLPEERILDSLAHQGYEIYINKEGVMIRAEHSYQ